MFLEHISADPGLAEPGLFRDNYILGVGEKILEDDKKYPQSRTQFVS